MIQQTQYQKRRRRKKWCVALFLDVYRFANYLQRRLVQNRVSQRNFRKRQANERMRLEEQVKMLSSELHNLSDAYQDLLGRFEQVHRENSVANSEVISSWMGDSSNMGPFNMATGLE
jgi:hypothetical protein